MWSVALNGQIGQRLRDLIIFGASQHHVNIIEMMTLYAPKIRATFECNLKMEDIQLLVEPLTENVSLSD